MLFSALRKKLLTGAFFILTACLVGCKSHTVPGFGPGDAALDFTLPQLAGGEASLSDFKGKGVLLNFWATWCGPCIEEMPDLQKLHDTLSVDGFSVVAIAVSDDTSAVKDFVTEHKITFPIFLDSKGTIATAYKVKGYPESFFLNPEGRFVMFPDLEKGMPAVRLIGPRAWTSGQVGRQIREFVLKK